MPRIIDTHHHIYPPRYVAQNLQRLLDDAILLPASALKKRFAMRQASLTRYGRSAALIVATVGDKGEDFLLTVSAATPRPVHIRFKNTPSAAELHKAIDERLPPDGWFNDVHGSAPYKRHVTFYLAEQIRAGKFDQL